MDKKQGCGRRRIDKFNIAKHYDSLKTIVVFCAVRSLRLRTTMFSRVFGPNDEQEKRLRIPKIRLDYIEMKVPGNLTLR